MKKIFQIISASLFIFPVLTLSINFAQAAPVCTCNGRVAPLSQTDCTGSVGAAAGCTWAEPSGSSTGGSTSGGSVDLTSPIKATDVPTLIGNIINVLLGIVGSLALVMFIYGGFTWMLAAGNENAVEKGKNILMWAAIGLVVIFASYSLVNFVISAITTGKGT